MLRNRPLGQCDSDIMKFYQPKMALVQSLHELWNDATIHFNRFDSGEISMILQNYLMFLKLS
jgi:hypothetical protein